MNIFKVIQCHFNVIRGKINLLIIQFSWSKFNVLEDCFDKLWIIGVVLVNWKIEVGRLDIFQDYGVSFWERGIVLSTCWKIGKSYFFCLNRKMVKFTFDILVLLFLVNFRVSYNNWIWHIASSVQLIKIIWGDLIIMGCIYVLTIEVFCIDIECILMLSVLVLLILVVLLCIVELLLIILLVIIKIVILDIWELIVLLIIGIILVLLLEIVLGIWELILLLIIVV